MLLPGDDLAEPHASFTYPTTNKYVLKAAGAFEQTQVNDEVPFKYA